MKLAEVLVARAVWLFDFNELNPRGTALGPVLKTLVDRYQFLVQPTPTELAEANKKGLTFRGGTFGKKKPIDIGLQVYNDGLIADTQSATEDSESFLDEVLSWTSQEFGLNYHDKLVKDRRYESGLTFHMDIDLSAVCEKLHTFTKVLTKLEAAGGKPRGLTGIAFKSEDATANLFTFERRANIPFSEKKYFSHSAFPTKRHIELLEEFERLLTA